MSGQKYSDENLKRIAGLKDELENDRLALLLEVVSDIKLKLSKVSKQNEFEEVKSYIKIFKAAVPNISREVHELDQSVIWLEND